MDQRVRELVLIRAADITTPCRERTESAFVRHDGGVAVAESRFRRGGELRGPLLVPPELDAALLLVPP